LFKILDYSVQKAVLEEKENVLSGGNSVETTQDISRANIS
jgi:hypothetical protein